MIIFISLKKLIRTFWWLIGAMVLYVLYQTIGLNMLFMLAVGLLALKFFPVLLLPILLIAIGVRFTGDFSFIADGITWGFWSLLSVPICYAFVESVYVNIRQRKKDKE
ncbi:hypothetical protein J5583_01165 [Streptococcus suis]|uniref:hypothetical protein n=1 Tax=Streptococcus suis TaxID=1307 RepID=UPI001ABDC42D|nr:hypothetical protein [Streptococcus suis]MBO4108798.1 hypothetical protein [Streptococcus suis]